MSGRKYRQFLRHTIRQVPAAQAVKTLAARALVIPAAGFGYLMGLQWSLFIACLFVGFALFGAGLYFWQPGNAAAAGFFTASDPAGARAAMNAGKTRRAGSSIPGGIAYIGGIANRGSDADLGGIANLGGITDRAGVANRAAIALEGRALLRQIRLRGNQIGRSDLREAIARICSLGEKVIDLFENESPGSPDPSPENGSPGYLAGRRFVDTYLSATLRIVTLYQDLATRSRHTEKESAVLERTAHMLPLIEAGFLRQLSRLQENRFLSLDVELAMMELSLKADEY